MKAVAVKTTRCPIRLSRVHQSPAEDRGPLQRHLPRARHRQLPEHQRRRHPPPRGILLLARDWHRERRLPDPLHYPWPLGPRQANRRGPSQHHHQHLPRELNRRVGCDHGSTLRVTPTRGHPQAWSRTDVQAQGCVLTPPCNGRSEGRPTTARSQRGWSETLFRLRQGTPFKSSSQTGSTRLGWHCKRSMQRFRWSRADLWAWLDLNQRPHPYQRWTAERCAKQHFRWSRDTVSATGMG
jgi:hypothetical protein